MTLASSAARTSIPTSVEQALFFPWDSPEEFTTNPDLEAGIEIGLRFFATSPGQLVGMRFWIAAEDTTATITVRAWTGAGTALASKAITGFAVGGWVRVYFDAAIDLAQDETYVISRNLEKVGDRFYTPVRAFAFDRPITVGNITALSNNGLNGVFSLTAGTFPDQPSVPRETYFVDPIFRRMEVVAAGDVDATVAAGIGADSFPSDVSGILAAQSLGTDSANDAIGPLSGTLPTGAGTDTLAANDATGSESNGTGTDTGAIATSAATGSETQDAGTGTDGLAGSSTPVTTGYIASASGSGNWTAAASAQGAPDATNAIITCAAGATASGTLAAASYTVGPAPASHTRTKVELVATQRIDTTVGALSSASCIINHKKSDNSGSFAVYRSESPTTNPVGDVDKRNDGALVTNTYDITSAVSGWTDAEVLAAKTDFVAAANLLAVTGGNMLWHVDACQIRITYSRTGIT